MKLRAIQPIKHDGKRYAPGETFEAPSGAAKALLDAGVAVEVEDKKSSSKKS